MRKEEVEKTFEFIRRLKRIHPAAREVILYFYSPTPRRQRLTVKRRETGLRLPVMAQYGPDGPPLPTTPEEWTEPRWIRSTSVIKTLPGLTARVRQRVKDFSTVLGCRFPTVQDYRIRSWGKTTLRTLASWRYATRRYTNPWELKLARRLIPLRQPQRESL